MQSGHTVWVCIRPKGVLWVWWWWWWWKERRRGGGVRGRGELRE